ncbi:hypothetical protein PCANC_04806 [Puccinia coronata f. sp. avenae]|uniref:3'(2'),5'-bisphosphate nucleotidase n=1 Tax=Puccinia coronata f. sp. avenae TaxID=200324 RepID=A0A2N5W2K0_9BASI|nr:hypothetical protein PCANC_04806 [Puccinia coronata f. sp. avenae]
MAGALLRLSLSSFYPFFRRYHPGARNISPPSVSGQRLAECRRAFHRQPIGIHQQPPIKRPSVEMIPAKNDTYRREREVAVAAVLQASIVTRRIFDQLIRPHLTAGCNDKASITKVDRSPVTVGDYTVQALVNFILSKYFPNDEIVGEEDSSELLNTTDKKYLEQIVNFTNQALTEDRLSTGDDEKEWAEFRNQSKLSQDDLVKLIDLGNSMGGKRAGNRRFWTLDPIDGTKGFLRGEHYAICLALIVDGKVVLGVVGTPNLPLQGASCPPTHQPEGVLFFAEEGAGAFQRPLDSDQYTAIQIPYLSPEVLAQNGTFCESTESAHSDHRLALDIVTQLKMANAQSPIRIDSQAKYCILARGDTHLYFRLPTQPDYQEKIWDHAAGSILISEAGGKVTDLKGEPLDFSCGRTLSNNQVGFVAVHRLSLDHVLLSTQEAARKCGVLPPQPSL